MSQGHFLIHYTHNTCSKYDEILEMSVNTPAKKHKQDVRIGGSTVVYLDLSFWHVSIWPKLALQTQ